MIVLVSMLELGRNLFDSVFIASGAKCVTIRTTLWANGSLALLTKYEGLGVNVARLSRQDWFPRAIGQLGIAQYCVCFRFHCVTIL